MTEYNSKLSQVYSNNVGEEILAEDILSSAGFILSVAPSKFSGEIDTSLFKPIGLIQSFYISGSKNITPVFEVGSRRKTVMASKGPKQLMMTRVMTYNSNVLAALYQLIDSSVSYDGKVKNEYDLSSDKSMKPFGMVITVLTEAREVLCYMYFEEAQVESHAENRTAGERGIMEQVSIKWSNYKVVDGGTA